jgi:hypothetical protein
MAASLLFAIAVIELLGARLCFRCLTSQHGTRHPGAAKPLIADHFAAILIAEGNPATLGLTQRCGPCLALGLGHSVRL